MRLRPGRATCPVFSCKKGICCAAAYKDFCVNAEIERRDHADSSKEKFEAERARKLKLENDLRERLLVEMPDAVAAMDYILGEVRTDLAGIPARMTEDVAERRRLEDGINEILAGLARKLDEAGSAIQEGRDPLEAGETIDA